MRERSSVTPHGDAPAPPKSRRWSPRQRRTGRGVIWPVLLLAEEAIERAGDDPLMLHRLQLVAADIETADDLLRNMLEPAQLTVGRGGLLRVYSLYAFAGAYADAVRPH